MSSDEEEQKNNFAAAAIALNEENKNNENGYQLNDAAVAQFEVEQQKKIIPIQENLENRNMNFSAIQLKEQVLFFKQKNDEFNQNFQQSDNEEFYLLSLDWLKKWKLYVGYDLVVSDQDPEQSKDFMADYPGEFNRDLLEDQNTPRYKSFVFNNEDVDDPTNILLIPNLIENQDFIIVNREIMENFYDNYYGKIIFRRAYPRQSSHEPKRIEIYYKELSFFAINNEILRSIDLNKFLQFDLFHSQVSYSHTLKQFRHKIIPFLNSYLNQKQQYQVYQPKTKVTEAQIRLWKLDNQYNHVSAYDYVKDVCKKTPSYDYKIEMKGDYLDKQLNEKLEDVNLTQEDILIVECREDSKNWSLVQEGVGMLSKCHYCHKYSNLDYICKCKKAQYCSEECKFKDKTYHYNQCPAADDEDDIQNIDFSEKPSSKKGLVGLSNLGNTCFMNSALQCLSNTWMLTNFFIEKKYIQDINKNNPLGSKGKLANHYASFVKSMWIDSNDVYSPYGLKAAIANLNPMYQGFQQHDSQEFLAFLLDGLHEDLNRVIQKQFTETIESNDRPYYQVARESWINHLKRNESIIVDLFHGQFKSKVVCPQEGCNRVAETFDPFSVVSVPIPKNKKKNIDFHFIFEDNRNKAYKLKIDFLKDSDTMLELRNKTAKLLDKDPKNIRFMFMSYNSIQKDIYDNDMVNSIRKKGKQFNLFAQEYSQSDLSIPQEYLVEVTVYMQKKEQLYYQSSKKKFTFARLFYFDKRVTTREMHLKIFGFNKFLFEEFAENPQQKQEIQQMDNQEAYEKLILGQNSDDSDSDGKNGKYFQFYKQQANKIVRPYKVQLITNTRGYSECYYCGQRNCENCQLPEDDTTLEQLLQKIPEKALKHDFELEVYWDNYLDKIDVSRLNTCSDFKQNKMDEQKGEAKVSLYDCLELFSQSEKLDENNTWYCNKCKEHQQATKQIEIYKAPKIMIIQIKRFRHQQHMYSVQMGVISTHIDFPIENLDMTDYVLNHQFTSDYFENSKNTIKNLDLEELIKNNQQFLPDKFEGKRLLYDLFAISNHYGSVGCGHYTAYAKNQKTNKWYNFDDSRISEVDNVNQIVSSNAYLLFYKRKDDF